MGDEPIPLECLGAGRIIRCHERCTYEDKSLKRSGLSQRIPLGDQDNAVGRIRAAVNGSTAQADPNLLQYRDACDPKGKL